MRLRGAVDHETLAGATLAVDLDLGRRKACSYIFGEGISQWRVYFFAHRSA